MIGRLSRVLGRQAEGPPAMVPEGEVVYAVGDIHGRRDLLETLHARILADAEKRDAERHSIVYLGDYVDRGLESREVVDLLLDAPLADFEAVHLMGNHEDMMLDFLDEMRQGANWLYNGGLATLHSYGVDTSGGWRFGDALVRLQASLRDRLPEQHRRFLRGLALQHRAGDYLFVHAGIRPGVEPERQAAEDLMWIREEFLNSRSDHGCVVVHGHTITDEPELRPNRIGIDTGAFATGRLTCLALEGEERRLLQT